MRVRLLTFALAALAGEGAAVADVTAHYQTLAGTPLMTVQANDRGDSRLSYGNQTVVIIRDGVGYLVSADPTGIYVVRQEDAMAALEEAISAMADDSDLPDISEAVNRYPPTESGTETVGGRIGTVWLLEPRAAGTDHGEDMVISTDPALTPIGRAIARRFEEDAAGISIFVGPDGVSGSFPPEVMAILQRGTLLRLGSWVRLHSIEEGPIPDSVFALPAEPLTREQFMARIGWQRPRPD